MTHSSSVLLLAGAADPAGQRIASAVLAAGGKVAAAVSRAWQVDKLRESLGADVGSHLLVGVVTAGDAQAAAGFVKGAKDALGVITHFAGASQLLRERVAGREPAGDSDELLAANLNTNATLCRAVLSAMRRRKAGRLLFVAAPDSTEALSVTCRVSLAALAEFAAAIAADLVDAGIGVETVPALAGLAVEDPHMARWLRAVAPIATGS
ncbi:MAG: NADP-dependent 3-hydroxy acid dehydrogenase YdfG [Candidatus Azotimanducaceae bacterium]|jgi:NADP-dependent 3-hydroxy acid dehydrogenase YdfG